MAEKSELMKDKSRSHNTSYNVHYGEEVSENATDHEISEKSINWNRSKQETSFVDDDAELTWALSSNLMEDTDETWVNEASQDDEGINDESIEYGTTLTDMKVDFIDHCNYIKNTTDGDKCNIISDELTSSKDTKTIDPLKDQQPLALNKNPFKIEDGFLIIDPLNVECEASKKDERATELSEDKNESNSELSNKDCPAIREKPKVKLALIIFDATDLEKGFKTLRLNTAQSMSEIKKLFPKHLGATEDTFMLYFKNREVTKETPLELFGENLEEENNVIHIVRSIKIKLGGIIKKPSNSDYFYLDQQPSTPFSNVRETIARHLKEPAVLIGLVCNGKEVLNEQTPKSLQFRHGEVLQVFRKDKMKIQVMLPMSSKRMSKQTICLDIDPRTTTIGDIKSEVAKRLRVDEQIIMMSYNNKEVHDHDTPVTLKMADNDILGARSKTGVFIQIKGPIGMFSHFYIAEEPLGELLQAYKQKNDEMPKPYRRRAECFVFKFNGKIVKNEDTIKSLKMDPGDCITVSEHIDQIFIDRNKQVLRHGFMKYTMDTQRKFEDIRKMFSQPIGADFNDLVFTTFDHVRGRVTIRDDDTLESLDLCRKNQINVELIQHIQVEVRVSSSGEETLSLKSNIRPGVKMVEWKSEICAKLNEPLYQSSFMWKGSNISNLVTPEELGIQDGDTVLVHCKSSINIKLVKDGQVLMECKFRVDQDFYKLATHYSQEFRVGINSVEFKYRNRKVYPFETPFKIGLMENGAIEVCHQRSTNAVTVEFAVEDSVLVSIFPELHKFPLLLDVNILDQVFLVKALIAQLSGLKMVEDPSILSFRTNTREINDGETLQEIGFVNGDKISVGIREGRSDRKKDIHTVYVCRNVEETKSNMGNGNRLSNNIELCAFKLDKLKPFSEFIKNVKSRITCTSEKDKLFVSFSDDMLNKDELPTYLNLPQYNDRFKCHAFPNLESFKNHLETVRKERLEYMERIFGSEVSLSSEDSDYPWMFPNKKRSDEISSKENGEDNISSEHLDLPTKPSNIKHRYDDQDPEKRIKDAQKKLKGLQMRINRDKKKQKVEGISLAKDIDNHKDFSNVDDVLRFIGEDLNSNQSEDKTENSTKRKQKNKNRNKKQASKESDKKVDTNEKLESRCASRKDHTGDNEQVETVDTREDNRKNLRKKENNNAKCNISDFIMDEELKARIKEETTTNVESSREEKNRLQATTRQGLAEKVVLVTRDSKVNVGGDEQTIVEDLKKGETQPIKNGCVVCTFINPSGSIFCDACGHDLEADWKKVGIENKKNPPTKAHSKRENNATKTNCEPFSHHKKLLEKSKPRSNEKYIKEFENNSFKSKNTNLSYREQFVRDSRPRSNERGNKEYTSKKSDGAKPKITTSRLDHKQSVSNKEADDVAKAMLKQVENKNEVFMEKEKPIEYTNYEGNWTTSTSTSYEIVSPKEKHSQKEWSLSEMHAFHKNKIQKESSNTQAGNQETPLMSEDEEETRKWSQLMVAERKRKDAERKRDYIQYVDMQSRNSNPQVGYEDNVRMYCDKFSTRSKPIVPQPKGNAQKENERRAPDLV